MECCTCPCSVVEKFRNDLNVTWVWFCLQFDYLKSLEIEEKINKIRWCQTANGARFLLSTNDKTIKLWKVPPAKAVSLLCCSKLDLGWLWWSFRICEWYLD